MTLGMGWVIDNIGTKLGLALSLIVWSVFGIANAFVGRLLLMHIIIRSAFAVGEAGNFPASIKTVAEWFPKRERALATAILQQRFEFRRDDRGAVRSVVPDSFRRRARMENGLHPHRRVGLPLADFLVLALRHAPRTKAAFQG